MPQTHERLTLDYQNLSQKYAEHSSNYNKQYCSIYLVRMKQMAELLKDRIEKKWNNRYPVCQLYRLSEETYDKCVVIGTLFKDQKLKPSILKKLSESNALVPQPVVTHFTDKSDLLFVEDELQRYQIVGSLQCDMLVTGITCALLGFGDDKGKFMAEDYVFAGYRPQVERPLLEAPAYVVLLSGLDLVNYQNIAPNLDLLTYWLCDVFGDLDQVATSTVTRLIIAGNSVRNVTPEIKPSISMLSRRPEGDDTIEAVRLLDQVLLDLSKVVEVDVMPGENDPSNHILPQKPMHHCMFPKSFAYKSLNQVTNPYWCSVGGVRISGTSGQPVKDVMRYSEITDPLEVLERCLEWSHLAPTAPDTLGCFPFYDSDPFVIEECPHVFFAGNQKEFATKEVEGTEGQKVRLICVPEFSETFQVCLLNLKTLDCTSVSFKTL